MAGDAETIGVEEEFFLVDRNGLLVQRAPEALDDAEADDSDLKPELLRCQMESATGTVVHQQPGDPPIGPGSRYHRVRQPGLRLPRARRRRRPRGRAGGVQPSPAGCRTGLWRAAKDGIEGRCPDPETGKPRPVLAIVDDLVQANRARLAQAGELDPTMSTVD